MAGNDDNNFASLFNLIKKVAGSGVISTCRLLQCRLDGISDVKLLG